MSNHRLGFDDLKGKVAAITGGAGVLSSTFARALVAAGVKVALLDIDAKAATGTAEQIAATPDASIIGIACDVLCAESLEHARSSINETFGAIDILINGAGGNSAAATTEVEQITDPDALSGSFFGLEMSGIEAVFDLNFKGTLLPTKVLCQDMVSCGGGVVINISSMAAYRPLSKIPAYSAAKAAVSNLTQWLSVHLAPMGIRVNAIAPGFFLTEQLKYLAFDASGKLTPRYERVIGKTAMKRLGEPEELQGALLYLASDLSSFVTGAVLPVDGGFDADAGI